MSYAFPEVRDLLLRVFREVATRYDIEGVNPIFNRGAPFLLYEEPLVEGFRRRDGSGGEGAGGGRRTVSALPRGGND